MKYTTIFRPSILAWMITSILIGHAQASVVRSDINYQDARDFAENKGKFAVGARNIAIYNTSGQLLGTMMTTAPMPDFGAVDKVGIATLIEPQFINSVAHNAGYTTVNFGHKDAQKRDFDYQIVARNNLTPTITNTTDFHAPRLHKLVTEVAPMPVHYAGEHQSAYQDPNRFSAYARLGSGLQYVGTGAENNEKTYLAWAYRYLTGGNVPNFSQTQGVSTINFQRNMSTANGIMPTIIEQGDSGSPLLAYDIARQQWGVIGVTRGYSSDEFWYLTMKPHFVAQKLAETYAGTVDNTRAGSSFTWTPSGTSSRITGNGQALTVNLKGDDSLNTSTEMLALNQGKSVKFTGQAGTLVVVNPVHQGAGALEFETDYTVKGRLPSTTWVGAGVVVADNKTVNWQLKNPAGDRLSKLGKGTLMVNGAGVNAGDISVGDGKVVLATAVDARGNKQAFNRVEIVSGRPTVVLGDANQVVPENIIFGYRGGRLDLNGTTFNTKAISSQDDGAMLVNHNTTATANVIIRGLGKVDPVATWVQSSQADAIAKRSDVLTWGQWGTSGADIYEYINTHAGNRKDYFILKSGGNAGTYFPTNQTSNQSWEYIGSDKNTAINTAFTQKMAGELTWGKWGIAGADIYEYINTHAGNRKDYFILKSGGNAGTYFPTNQTSNQHWQYLGSDKLTAINAVIKIKDYQSLDWGKWGTAGADIYEYINTHAGNRTDYFVLKAGGNAGAFYPTNQTSSDNWEYLGSDKQRAIQTVLSRQHLDSGVQTFAGVLGETAGTNGRMNVTFKPTDAKDSLFLTGGARLNGELKVNNGTVLLTGRPVPYAYNHQTKQEIIKDDDWINREYRANAFSVNHDGKLIFGRNASLATGNFYAAQNGLLQLGFVQGKTPVCQRSDHTGAISCTTPTVGTDVYQSIPTLKATGDTRLWHNADLHIGKAVLTGKITADKGTTTTIEHDGQWQMTADSTVGHLALNGGTVDLNAANNHSRYQSLTINGNLSGQGKFYYLTNADAGVGDRVTVNGVATGNFSLAMQNTGAEPTAISPLSLLNITNNAQDPSALNVSLENGYVDLGAYRYILKNQNNDYRLYSPLRDVQVARNYEQIEALLADAQASADAYAQEVDELTTRVINTLAEQQSVQASIAQTQRSVNAQQSYLNSLPWIRFAARIQARNQLLALQKQLGSYTTLNTQLQTTIEALNRSLAHAQDQQANAQSKLEAVDLMVKDVLKQAEDICLKTQSQEVCNAVVRLTSAEELLDLTNALDAQTVNIAQKDGISSYSNTALSELSAQVNSLLQAERAIDKELVTPKSEPLSVWVAYDTQASKSNSDNYRSYHNDSTMTQFGIEGAVSDTLRAGMVLSAVDSTLAFDGAQGDGKLKSATAYLKAQSPSGWIGALQAGVGQADNAIEMNDKSTKIERDISTVGLSVAKTYQANNWQIRPSAGVKYHRLAGVDYTLDNAAVSTSPLGLTTYQAGLSVAYPMTIGQVQLVPSVSSTYTDASHNQRADAVRVNGNALALNFDRYTTHELGVTATANNWSASINAGVIDGEEMDRQRHAGVRIGYQW
ncbi:S6 family peptidase [uncultured Moraxella sp.]|uniref:S6 family peptidase n=1 Tax=uncultured Moraxella sp. TaxID=263769 RepID=UPI0025E98B67|nr:S6 family peptidase [uncultured Moraxella sp.]